MPLWWVYSVLTQWPYPAPLLWSEENVRNFRIDLHGFDVLWLCVTDHDDLSLFWIQLLSRSKSNKGELYSWPPPRSKLSFSFPERRTCKVLFDFRQSTSPQNKKRKVFKKANKVYTKILYIGYWELSLFRFSFIF